jgi:hypothetical protein
MSVTKRAIVETGNPDTTETLLADQIIDPAKELIGGATPVARFNVTVTVERVQARTGKGVQTLGNAPEVEALLKRYENADPTEKRRIINLLQDSINEDRKRGA